MAISFRLNGKQVTVDAPDDARLLWVIRERLGLMGTKFGCGTSICGACTIHIDGQPVRSCVMPVSAAAGKDVTTIEGLSDNGDHPLQKAWVEEQVPQCGYCQSGQIMHAATLLAKNPNPSRDEIVQYMDSVLCRCGTYPRILRAIERAAKDGGDQ